MARQRASLAQHQVTIDKLFRARFHQDLLVDGTAFLVAWWVARSALVRYPISGASRVMGWLPLWAVWRTSAAATGVVVDHSALALRQRQATRFTRALLQLMAIVYVTRELRKMASGYGVHARVGSVFGYVRWLVHGKGDDGTSASEEPQAKRQVGEAAVDVPPISTAATAITLL